MNISNTPFYGIKNSSIEDTYIDLVDAFGFENDVKEVLYLKTISTHVPRLVKYATGYYYLRKLSRSQRKEFLKEFKLANKYVPVTYWLASNFENMDDFIRISFSWDHTAQRFDYWERIATKARWITNPLK